VQTEKAVLKMPSKWGDRVVRGQTIQTKLTNNVNFPTGWIAGTLTQAQFNADVLAFTNEETAVEAHTPGAVGLRNAAYKTLKQDLSYVMIMVQAKADANPNIAVTIIENAGFFVRGKSGNHKRVNEAYNTQIPGKVIITSDGGGHTQWEMTKDMITITNLPSTNTSKTSVSGLTYGETWYFRSKKVDTKQKTYNWSSWFLLKIGPGGRNLGGGTTSSSAGNLPTA
ncbi:MAG TPA: hypothetical protein VF411_07030, partial [Bacteroidia bacterium]